MNPPSGDDDRTVIRQGAVPEPAAAQSVATVTGPTYDSQSPAYAHTLPWGTRLGEFELHDLVGEGGFGIVYLAWDYSLERKVAVKEYMPSSIAARGVDNQVTARSERHQATFDAGLKSFIKEAKLLAMFDHPSLLKVYRFWEANGTAYMAMPFYEGVTLKETVAALPKPPDEAWLLDLLAPLTEALGVIHAEHCYHRDIAPDNIMLLAGSDRPLLLDFGAARRVIGDMNQSLTVILKPGYAPVEQYGEVPGMRQGPWTDVYALAAVVYWAITGKTPPPSVGRTVRDSMAPLAERASARYSAQFLRAIDGGLAVLPERRTQTIDALRQELGLSPLPAARATATPHRVGRTTAGDALPRSGAGERPAAAPPITIAAGPTTPEIADDAEGPTRQVEPRRDPVRGAMRWSNALRGTVAMAGVAVVLVAAGLWWASQAPTAEPSAAAAEPTTVGNAGVAAVPAPVDSSAPDEPAPVAAIESGRPPPRVLPTGDGPKPVHRPQGVGNSAECTRLMQSMSLDDSNPKLGERFNELGCR